MLTSKYGLPVVVLVRWRKGAKPRNVLIQRADGTKVVRPFRGLPKAYRGLDETTLLKVVIPVFYS